MKTRTLFSLVVTVMAINLGAQTINVAYGPDMEYGWDMLTSGVYFIDRALNKKSSKTIFTYSPTKTTGIDSLVVTEKYERDNGKITCTLKDNSLYLIKYEYFGDGINENPLKAFNNFIKNRNALMFQFYVYVKDGDKEYREYDEKIIADMVKDMDVKLCAKRYMMDNLTNVMLEYKEDGYHLYFTFEHKIFTTDMLKKN